MFPSDEQYYHNIYQANKSFINDIIKNYNRRVGLRKYNILKIDEQTKKYYVISPYNPYKEIIIFLKDYLNKYNLEFRTSWFFENRIIGSNLPKVDIPYV